MQAADGGQGGSHYLGADLARQAVSLAAPMMERALADREVVGSGFLYIVVMDPGRLPGECSFEDAVLYEQAFGDRSRWDADYAAFARAKAKLSWRTGSDGRRVQECLPHLLRTGDTVLAGSVCIDGIVVAASGAFPVFDEVFAGTVALCLRALARRAREAETAGVSLGDAPQS
ncbi:hypothetical protein GPA19_04755 [Azoarcus indigens]|uniref:Uncharacterized protein n=1 Tax=Azoarcus indigens TaxID=29545 RepID=A0A4R6EF12_9RHOO|nr:hypothetical protein [Azoarcus indigens]NMG64255.1 hypothetical protein [Azoarcus indigens]TDN55848.1 hypothetical protein C7389_103186 [Azoarcus indigens]